MLKRENRNYYDDDDEEDDTNYQMTFDYNFDFNFRKKIFGQTFVYRVGFYIEYSKPCFGNYSFSHCNHFSMACANILEVM